MSMRLAVVLRVGWGCASLALWARPEGRAADPIVVYHTGFEVAEGYSDDSAPLRGQMGWVGEGSGGNGLVADFFDGWGQQAFVGFAPPALKDETLNIWRPVGLPPLSPTQPVVKFSVLMQIVDSTNGEYDDFRWSVYNTASQRLFTLDFDNSRAEIFYALDDAAGFKSTGFTFANDVIYDLSILMNFWRNTWTAVMNGVVVVESQPITTLNARLDLSDVDAVWALRKKGAAGDNYLLFDDYTITLEPTPSIPPVLDIGGRLPTGEFDLVLHGERGLKYAIDVTSDFRVWSPLETNSPPNGVWDYRDLTAPDYPLSFYRARQVSN